MISFIWLTASGYRVSEFKNIFVDQILRMDELKEYFDIEDEIEQRAKDESE
jgi:hypothetical protein